MVAVLECLWTRIEALRRRDSRPLDWGRLTGMLADVGVSAPVSVGSVPGAYEKNSFSQMWTEPLA